MGSRRAEHASLNHVDLRAPPGRIPRTGGSAEPDQVVALHRPGRRRGHRSHHPWTRSAADGRAHKSLGADADHDAGGGCLPRVGGAGVPVAPASGARFRRFARGRAGHSRRDRRVDPRRQPCHRHLHGAAGHAAYVAPRSRHGTHARSRYDRHRRRHCLGGMGPQGGLPLPAPYRSARRARGLERLHLQQPERSAHLDAQAVRVGRDAQFRPREVVGHSHRILIVPIGGTVLALVAALCRVR
jgi:hypothetical protein